MNAALARKLTTESRNERLFNKIEEAARSGGNMISLWIEDGATLSESEEKMLLEREFVIDKKYHVTKKYGFFGKETKELWYILISW